MHVTKPLLNFHLLSSLILSTDSPGQTSILQLSRCVLGCYRNEQKHMLNLQDGNSKGLQYSCNTVTEKVKRLWGAAQPCFYWVRMHDFAFANNICQITTKQTRTFQYRRHKQGWVQQRAIISRVHNNNNDDDNNNNNPLSLLI